MSLARIIFNATHGKEDPERASLPFVAGNVAATAGQEAIVLCTIEAVWLGTKGGADGIASKGLDPLSKIYSDFVSKGGKVWLCGACTKPRGITEEQLATGATIVGVAKVVEEIALGASTTNFV
ncbi:MAG TPA: DsrE family protein [Nitrososphaerales archaeon]|nr:DsrE family protein [Nitrososphaerales archaeon]